MTPEQVAEMANLAIVTLLWVSAPLMFVALVVGLLIALFQALTSMQEMTLTFVPKILLIFAAMIFLLPWMADKMNVMTLRLFGFIAGSGG